MLNIIAHRGDTTQAHENTMQAFEAAHQTGVYGVELDIRLSADHTPVVFHHMKAHTDTLDGFISSYTSDELQSAILIGTDTKSYKIPRLADVLDTFAGKLYLEMHLQSYSPETITETVKLLQGYRQAWDLMEITCRDTAILAGIKAGCPGLAVDFLFRSESWMTTDIVLQIMLEKARLAQVRAVHLNPSQITAESVTFFRKHGFDVHAGGVDDATDLSYVRAHGITQVISNDIHALLKAL
ncbi:MAG: glycerophosphodiester phosphodiesterase [Aggregatilineales bacterium]